MAVVRFATALHGGVHARITLCAGERTVWQDRLVAGNREWAVIMAAARAQYEANRRGFEGVDAWDMPGCPPELPAVQRLGAGSSEVRSIDAGRDSAVGHR